MPRKRIQERTVEETDIPVPHMTKKTSEVVKFIPQEQVQNRTVRQIIDVPVPRVMEENTEVEKLDSGCAVQAPEWEELQRLRAEGLVSIHDINKLLMDSHSFELFKETLPSPSVMQVQSDKRGVVRRTHAVKRNSSRSPGMKLFSVEIGIGRAQDEDTSLATDINSHASAIADPTEQQQHCHSNQQQSTRQAMQQQFGEMGEKENQEKRERREERMKEEDIRKGEGRRKKENMRSRRT